MKSNMVDKIFLFTRHVCVTGFFFPRFYDEFLTLFLQRFISALKKNVKTNNLF